MKEDLLIFILLNHNVTTEFQTKLKMSWKGTSQIISAVELMGSVIMHILKAGAWTNENLSQANMLSGNRSRGVTLTGLEVSEQEK
jgi:hypothetical protein